jgi:hypothetical protein
MKKMFIFCLLVIPIALFSQSRMIQKNLANCMLSIEYAFECGYIKCYRITDDCYKGVVVYSKDYKLLDELISLQLDLNSIKDDITFDRLISDSKLENVMKRINFLRSKYSKLELNIYIAEIDFYRNIRECQQEKILEKAFQDSIKKQEKIQQENQRLAEIEIKQKEQEKAAQILKQKEDSVKKADPLKYKRDKLENHFTSQTFNKDYYKYYTQFSDMRFNFVNMRVQDYMKRNGYLEQETDFDYGKYIQVSYISKFSTTNNPEKIYIKYYVEVSDMENGFIIKSCDIYGYDYYVVNFFIKFWNTQMQYDNVEKNELVYYYLLEDKISLFWTPPKAKIEIRKGNHFEINDL